MAMNRARRTSNLNNILTYDTLGNSTLIANLTVEGLTGAGFVKADAAGLLSVDTAAYTVVTGATNYLTKITGASTLGQSLVYDNGTSVLVNSTVGVPGYAHAFQVVANPSGGLVVSTTDVASAIGIVNSASANKTWDISPYGNHLVINESGIATRMKFDAGGNITIGDIVNTGHKLEVVGSFRTTGTNTLSQLQGVGDRMVVANTNGVLTTQPIPTGSITGSGAAGQVNFWTGTNTVSGSNNLFWDSANGRLGIGTNAPSQKLHISNGDILIERNDLFAGFIVRSTRLTGGEGSAQFFLQSQVGDTNLRFLAYGDASNPAGAGTYIQSGNYARTANMPLLFSGYNGNIGSDLTFKFAKTMFTDGVALFGGTVSNGQRLQVYGDTLLRGSGATSATTALTIQDSSSNNLFSFRNNGTLAVPVIASQASPVVSIFQRVSATNIGTYIPILKYGNTADDFNQHAVMYGFWNNSNVSGFSFQHPAGSGGAGVVFNFIPSINQVSSNVVTIQQTFTRTAGGETITQLLINPTINQTGTSTGLTRGLYVNPSITAAPDWRSVEWGNNIGWGLYGAGTAPNYMAGALSIGVIGGSQGLRIGRAPTNADSASNFVNVAIPNTSTTRYRAFASSIGLNTSGFTLPDLSHFEAIQDGAFTVGVVTNHYGFRVNALTSGTNIYAFHSNVAAATNVWNLYMNGTAINYLNGALLIGSTTNDTVNKLQVTGTIVAGSATSTNGSVILRGSYTNGYLTTIGTDASSGGPIVSYGVESAQNSTAGAFVSSSGITIPRSAYVQNGGHVWHTAASSTTAIGTAITMTKHMELYNSGNLVLGGGADDATNRLQVGGNAFIKGTGNTNATIALQVQNSDGTNLIRAGNNNVVTVTNLVVNNSGGTTLTMPGNNYFFHDSVGTQGRLVFFAQNTLKIGFGGSSNGITINPSSSAVNELSGEINVQARTLRNAAIYQASVACAISGANTAGTFTANGTVGFDPTNNHAGGHLIGLYVAETFNPSSTLRDVNYSAARLSPIINQTGGAVSATRGILVSPTLTAAADWRSIEWSNNTGWGLYGVGSAKNYLNGTTLIGTTTDDGINKLQVAGSISSAGIMRADASRTAAINDVSIALLGSNITTYAAGFSMSAGGYGLNAIYAQHEQRFGGNATFDGGNLTGGGLILNKLAPTAAGTVTMTQQNSGLRVRTMSNLHLMTQFSGNNNLTVTHMSGMHIYGHYRTSGTGTLTVSTAYYGVFLADPNEFGTGATVTGTNWGFYQQGAAPINAFEGSMLVGTTTTDVNNRLVVSGNTRVTGNMTSAQFRLSALNTAPATATSTGVTGEIVIDANHIYVCTATNTWKRVAIATF